MVLVGGRTADGLAGVPTIVKSYKEPESENWHVFFFGATSAAITLLAINAWDFAHYGFPVYIFVICSLLAVIIRFKVGARRALAIESLVAEEDERPLP